MKLFLTRQLHAMTAAATRFGGDQLSSAVDDQGLEAHLVDEKGQVYAVSFRRMMSETAAPEAEGKQAPTAPRVR